MAKKTRKVDWDEWIEASTGSTDKVGWVLDYLNRNYNPTFAAVTNWSSNPYHQSQTKVISERLQQFEHAPSHTEAIRKMRLAWNSFAHREKARQERKKGYLFTMGIGIEAKLRRLATPGETLSEVVERLITLGTELEKTLRKEKEDEIRKAKKELTEKSSSKAKRHPLVKPKLGKTIASLKSEIELLSKQAEDNALIECRQRVLLQSNGLLNAELTKKQELQALSLYKKGR